MGFIEQYRPFLAAWKRRTGRLLRIRQGERVQLRRFHTVDRAHLSSAEIKAFMRHDAHRIEKSFYNKIFGPKRGLYEQHRKNVLDALNLLQQRGEGGGDETVEWAQEIAHTFEHLEDRFIGPKSTPAQPISEGASNSFLQLVSTRRSSRVWATEQPDAKNLERFAKRMIDAARWAPNSGNRQPLRFKIISDSDEKATLAGLKEEHCYAAPCIIFVGVDRRFYGGLGENEAGIYIDAGAAAMQMVLAAHASHYGVCWNHFSRDLIASRERNVEIYDRFVREQNIPDYIEPVAIIAFGAAAFHPPVPPRTAVDDLLL